VPRDHPAFDLLKDMHLLEKHENKAIILPDITDGNLAKELTLGPDLRFVQPILLTKQRIDIIKRFYNQVQPGKEDFRFRQRGNGLILSGPNGQGKSILCYLLACAAYANNCVVTYIVRNVFYHFDCKNRLQTLN